ncbi:MAG: hypothetical protein E6K56_07170 [Ignavibacteria bacterium]|nr:MAG: hypothetical protein E6K56_07170 [Ignavibacteria bacterium]
MKRCVLIILFHACVLSRVIAQDDTSKVKTPELSLAAGLSYPYLPQEFRDYWKKGWNTEISYGYSFSPGTVGYSSLFVVVEYARFAFDVTAFRTRQDLLQKNVSVTRNPVRMIGALLTYKGAFSLTKTSFAPYFLIGIGVTNLSAGSIDVTGDTSFTVSGQSRSAFAWSAGLGAAFPFTESSGFIVQGKSVLGVIDSTRQ